MTRNMDDQSTSYLKHYASECAGLHCVGALGTTLKEDYRHSSLFHEIDRGRYGHYFERYRFGSQGF